MAFKSAELTTKKRKLDIGNVYASEPSATHTHIVVPGHEHDAVRQVVAEGEQVLSSQAHERKVFEYEGSKYVITGPNRQVLVAYDAARPSLFWNEVTDQNFITAHLEHHPMRMETFVQDINKVYVQLTKEDAKEILKKVLGNRRIPYAAAVKSGNRDVRGTFVYAVVPPVLYNDYVNKQKRIAKRLSGSSSSTATGAVDGDTDAITTAPAGNPSPQNSNGQFNAQPARRGRGGGGGGGRRGGGRGGRGRGRGRRATGDGDVGGKPHQEATQPMDTKSDEKEDNGAAQTPQKSRYKPLSMSPVRRDSVSSALPAPTELSSNQSTCIAKINDTHQSLLAICTPLAHALLAKVGDEYLQSAIEQYHAIWNGCTTYMQLKQNMVARQQQVGEKYTLMDDLMWMFMLTNPQLVRALRTRVAQRETVEIQSGTVPRRNTQSQESKTD